MPLMGFQEQVDSVPYSRAMGSVIKTKINKDDIYNGMKIHSWLKKSTFLENAH
jgi:hypothetical protein